MPDVAPIIHVYDEQGRPARPRRHVVYTSSGRRMRNVSEDREGRLLVISDGPESCAIRFDLRNYLDTDERLEHVELSAAGVVAGVDYNHNSCILTVDTNISRSHHPIKADYSPAIGLAADNTRTPIHAEVMLRFIMSTREGFTERVTIRPPNRFDQRQGPGHNRGIV